MKHLTNQGPFEIADLIGRSLGQNFPRVGAGSGSIVPRFLAPGSLPGATKRWKIHDSFGAEHGAMAHVGPALGHPCDLRLGRDMAAALDIPLVADGVEFNDALEFDLYPFVVGDALKLVLAATDLPLSRLWVAGGRDLEGEAQVTLWYLVRDR